MELKSNVYLGLMIIGWIAYYYDSKTDKEPTHLIAYANVWLHAEAGMNHKICKTQDEAVEFFNNLLPEEIRGMNLLVVSIPTEKS